MISRFKPAVWIVAATSDPAVGRGLAFSYGVMAVPPPPGEPADFRKLSVEWVRREQAPGPVAMLVSGPAKGDPESNYRIEFVSTGERSGATSRPG
jgi:pyruvate kinase